MPLAPSGAPLTLADRVAEDIRKAIRRGELRGGMPLRQNEIARALGVSSTPVREAFAILQREGLVHRTVHRGAVVIQPTVSDLLAAYEIRAALEPVAARHATGRLTATEFSRLRLLIDEMGRSTSDADRYLELNESFHEIIEAAAGIPRLAELIADQRAATSAYVKFLGAEPDSYKKIHVEHKAILSALQRGIPEKAAAAVVAHLQARSDRLRERFPDAQSG